MLERLDKLHVGEFSRTKEYENEFNCIVERTNMCLSEKEQLTQREIDDRFQIGLVGG